MRPSFLQATIAAAAAVTSVAVMKERKEREARWRHREHNRLRHTYSPFSSTSSTSLFFLLCSILVRLFLASPLLFVIPLVTEFTEKVDITAVFGSCICFASRTVPPRGWSSSIDTTPFQATCSYETQQQHFIALSRTRESNFHLLVAFWNPADPMQANPPICF